MSQFAKLFVGVMTGGLLATAAGAQAVAGSFAPNPAAPGQEIAFTLTDSEGAGFAFVCPVVKIHAGAPDGPLVPYVQGCDGSVHMVGPNDALTMSWDQTDLDGNAVAPGRYWYEVTSLDPSTFAPRTDLFCISIQAPSAPSLLQSGPAKVGAFAPLTVRSPADPGAGYIVAASLTSNRPIQTQGICLSRDPLFRMSIRHPGSVFTNGVGTLDGSGQSLGLGVNVPNDPSLAYLGFHVQAAIVTSSGLRTTNDVALTIVP